MFKILDEACTPTRATKYSAMVDLYSRESVVIGAGETKIVPLGVMIDLALLKVEFKNNYCRTYEKEESINDDFNIFLKKVYLELHPRSSLRAKGLIIGVGICDLDYPCELGLIVHNPLNSIIIDAESNIIHVGSHEIENICNYTINKGDKIAQCTLKEHKGYLLGIESDAERISGFGSTGM